jgi:hypothetical protein
MGPEFGDLPLLATAMSSVLPVVFILAIVCGLMAVSWFFTPKGPNQVLVAFSWIFRQLWTYRTRLSHNPQTAAHKRHAHARMLFSHVDGHVPRTTASIGRCVHFIMKLDKPDACTVPRRGREGGQEGL